MPVKQAIIIGAGPAGLTAAYELLMKTDIKPVVIESSNEIGGISKTFNYKNNRMDMGGHRFFSKSDKVMKWWLDIMPPQTSPSMDDILLNRNMKFPSSNIPNDPQKQDRVMLVRSRLSRIFFLRSFFNYPVSLNWNTVKNLGFVRILKSGLSYAYSMFIKRDEKSLEDFMINRFGKELYLTFFKDYTYKVWGVQPAQIPADWGAQRIKGLSVIKILSEALKKVFGKSSSEISQKNVETSLIEQFYYPKYGPGHFWETVADEIKKKGGKIVHGETVCGIYTENNTIKKAAAKDKDGNIKEYEGQYFISTMPVKELIASFDKKDESAKKTAEGLVYRDFITVGLLVKNLEIKNNTKIPSYKNIAPDLWIYIQERDVKIGRLQIFNNWSPYMVKDFENTVWIGLEYFCTEGDELWNMKEDDFINFAADELEKINIIKKENILDKCMVKVPKAYPAYFGTYNEFGQIKDFTDKYENLFLAGRNGMHRYNNMDHSMLTAMTAVENIVKGIKTKDNIWQVNTESDYHEEK
ncbi:MAG: NAD(P)/FAD-dependent oxidoreductase [Endomicrobia bacterium]|nr:NAD(P)/FAD-dependent oxidoreductase [Endomicrobiia bacterium]